MTPIRRHEVFRSDRIRVTEAMIASARAARILEIGAGDYSFGYMKPGMNSTWTRVDFDLPCDVICNLNSNHVVLPFKGEVFDLVICTEVLEHLLWPQFLLSETHRVLKVNGLLLVSVPNACSLTYRIAWMVGRIPSCAASANLPPELGGTTYAKGNGELVGGHVIDFNLSRLLRLLSICGYATVTVRGSGIIWYKQVLPSWLVPAILSSNIIVLAKKK